MNAAANRRFAAIGSSARAGISFFQGCERKGWNPLQGRLFSEAKIQKIFKNCTKINESRSNPTKAGRLNNRLILPFDLFILPQMPQDSATRPTVAPFAEPVRHPSGIITLKLRPFC